MKTKQRPDMEDLEFHEANRFMEQRQYGKAEQALRRGLNTARDEGDLDSVTFYYHALGSSYLLQKKKKESLHFYQRGDNASDNYHAKLAYARLLTSIFGAHSTGLEKVKEALDLMPKGDQATSQGYSVMGLCYLGIGDRENAIKAFVKSFRSLSARLTPSDGYDLTLASEFIRRGIYDKTCLSYLRRVKRQAKREGNERVLQMVNKLLEKTTDMEQISRVN